MSELEYRRALKALPREIEPRTDLWPGIAARIAPPSHMPRRRPEWLRYAIAAGLTGLALAAMLMVNTASRQTAERVATLPPSPWVLREADLMKVDMQAALNSVAVPESIEVARAHNRLLTASLREIDSAEAELDQALRQNPDSTFLLERMRQLHQKKARLTLRALAA